MQPLAFFLVIMKVKTEHRSIPGGVKSTREGKPKYYVQNCLTCFWLFFITASTHVQKNKHYLTWKTDLSGKKVAQKNKTRLWAIEIVMSGIPRKTPYIDLSRKYSRIMIFYNSDAESNISQQKHLHDKMVQDTTPVMHVRIPLCPDKWNGKMWFTIKI